MSLRRCGCSRFERFSSCGAERRISLGGALGRETPPLPEGFDDRAVPTVSAELKRVLRLVKLSRRPVTLAECLALAKTWNMGHAQFLELVLPDKATRRETTTAVKTFIASALVHVAVALHGDVLPHPTLS